MLQMGASAYYLQHQPNSITSPSQLTHQQSGHYLSPNTASGTSVKQKWQIAAQSARFIRRKREHSLTIKTHSHRSLMSAPQFSYTIDSLNNVVMCFEHLVAELKMYIQPLQAAESSVLVDVLHFPEKLFDAGYSGLKELCAKGGVCSKWAIKLIYHEEQEVITGIFRLIQHCKLLLDSKQEQLCGRVLTTLTKMIASTKYNLNHQACPPHKGTTRLVSLTKFTLPIPGKGGQEGAAPQLLRPARSAGSGRQPGCGVTIVRIQQF